MLNASVVDVTLVWDMLAVGGRVDVRLSVRLTPTMPAVLAVMLTVMWSTVMAIWMTV